MLRRLFENATVIVAAPQLGEDFAFPDQGFAGRQSNRILHKAFAGMRRYRTAKTYTDIYETKWPNAPRS